MNIFEAIYNIETFFYLVVMVGILLLTLYLGRNVHTEKQAFNLSKVVIVEVLLIAILYLLLTRMGSKAKSIFGIFDLLNMAK